MRLLNVEEPIKLESFDKRPYPRYAILSHTWSLDYPEVTLRDMEDGTASKKKKGFEKLKSTCYRAKADNIKYVWIDTCCIDKNSSAELSESINSMFLWYKEAKVCYAFMEDVPDDDDALTSAHFAKSRWFTRGWTLQELIAPKSVIFYSKGWVELGRRSELASVISRITRIDEGILTRMQDLKYVSVSKRMSWASDRQTGRPEDIAYCLMGIFDVNMAMLYGEGGEKAFRRLQEEIMKDSDDETLFAWSNTRHAQPELQGLLATSPADFRNSSHYIPDYDRGAGAPNSITSKGLCINLGLQLLEDDIWIGALECPVPPMYEESLAIYLKRLDKQGQQYARVKADRLCKIPQKGPVQTIYVRQHPLIPGFDDVLLHHVFQLRKAQICEKGSAAFRSLAEQGYYLVETAAPSLGKEIEPLPTSAPNWIPTSCKKTFQIPRGAMRLASALMFKRSDGTDVIVMLGSKPGFGIAVDVVPYEDIAKRKSRKTKTLSLILDDHAEGLLDLNFQELEDSFNPQSPGEWFHLGPDSFRIDIQPRTRAGMRYYMVDIWIERTPTLTPEDLLSLPVVGGFVAGLPSLDPEIVSARSGKPSDGKGRRWKNPFKPSRN